MPGLEARQEHQELLNALQENPKRVPVSYLYDGRGSSLYDQITKLTSYYPYAEEHALLEGQAASMARYVPSDAVVVELGCGTASKTCILLKEIARQHSRLEFAGIDVSPQFLAEARANVEAAMASLEATDLGSKAKGTAPPLWRIHTVCAEYLDGLRQVRRMFPDRQLVLLWLGSSVGNLEDAEARPFFRELVSVMGPRTRLLLATDLWKSRSVLRLAYDEPEGVTAAFIKNGLRHALRSLGVPVAEKDEELGWEYQAVVCPVRRRVEMWVLCQDRVEVVPNSITIEAGERVFLEISRKFTRDDVATLAQASGLLLYDAWSTDLYGMQLLVSPEEAMRLCWEGSDAFFAGIGDWSSTPIEYRRPFSFYYGHLAAFAALKLIPERGDRASPLDVMYSRGIDPNLLDPSKCHSHPAAPNEWPQEPELKAYVDATREDIRQFLASEALWKSNDYRQVVGGMRRRLTMRGVLLALEHEFMHLETLAYMKAQEDIAQWLLHNCPSHKTKSANGKYHPAGPRNGMNGTEGPGKEMEKENLVTGTILQGHKAVGPGANHMGNGTAGATHALLPVRSSSGASGAPVARGASGVLKAPVLDVVIPPGPVPLGADVSDATAMRFVWDNEGPPVSPARSINHGLAVSSRPVTVRDWHSFVTCANGYSRPELWLSDDWLLLQKRNQSCPATWTLAPSAPKEPPAPADGQRLDYWVYVGPVTGEQGVTEKDDKGGRGHPRGCMRPWQEVANLPVFVSLAEAEAFCKALGGGARVMTEEEWNLIAQASDEETVGGGVPLANGGHVAGSPVAGNGLANGTTTGHSAPKKRNGLADGVECFLTGEANSVNLGGSLLSKGKPRGRSTTALQVLQKSIREGGWEWTSTPFEPFPGFEAMEDYPEYSTDFFDGVHFVLKGSSPATHPAMLRDSFRNFYQRQYPYVFAKFRICKEVVSEVLVF